MIKIKNNYIQTFQVANFATCSWCGSQGPAPSLLYPFVAGHHVSSLSSFSSGQKDHLILVVVAATTTIFTFRNNASEQYQKNIDIVRNNIKEKPTLFRNFSTLFRKHIFAGFSSYQKDNLISSAHFAHLIDKAMWAAETHPQINGSK